MCGCLKLKKKFNTKKLEQLNDYQNYPNNTSNNCISMSLILQNVWFEFKFFFIQK